MNCLFRPIRSLFLAAICCLSFTFAATAAQTHEIVGDPIDGEIASNGSANSTGSASLRAGKDGGPAYSAFLVFDVSSVAPGDAMAADLKTYLEWNSAGPRDLCVYSMGFTDSPFILPNGFSSYFGSAETDPDGNTLLQDDYIPAQTTTGQFITMDAAGQSALLQAINNRPSGKDYLFLRLNLSAGAPSTSSRYEITSADSIASRAPVLTLITDTSDFPGDLNDGEINSNDAADSTSAASLRAGKDGGPAYSAFLVFDISGVAPGDATGADLKTYLEWNSAGPRDLCLYSMGFTDSPFILPNGFSSYFGSAETDPDGNTLLQDDYIPAQTTTGQFITIDAAGQSALLQAINNRPSGKDYLFLRLNLSAGAPSTSSRYEITSANGSTNQVPLLTLNTDDVPISGAALPIGEYEIDLNHTSVPVGAIMRAGKSSGLARSAYVVFDVSYAEPGSVVDVDLESVLNLNQSSIRDLSVYSMGFSSSPFTLPAGFGHYIGFADVDSFGNPILQPDYATSTTSAGDLLSLNTSARDRLTELLNNRFVGDDFLFLRYNLAGPASTVSDRFEIISPSETLGEVPYLHVSTAPDGMMVGAQIDEPTAYNVVYTVDPNGSDTSGDGSSANPFKTLTHTLQYARDNSLNSGLSTKIALNAGGYQESAFQSTWSGGGEDALLCIEGDPAGDVILNPDGTQYYALRIEGKNNLIVRNIKFRNGGEGPSGKPHHGAPFISYLNPVATPAVRPHDWLVENCEFSNNNGSGARIIHIDNLTVRDCKVFDNDATGIQVMGRWMYLKNIEVYNNETDDLTPFGGGGMTFGGYWVLADGLNIYNNVDDGFDMDIIGRDIIIKNSVFSHNTGSGMMFETCEGPVLIENCDISGNGDYGIRISTAHGITMDGITALDNVKAFMEVAAKNRDGSNCQPPNWECAAGDYNVDGAGFNDRIPLKWVENTVLKNSIITQAGPDSRVVARHYGPNSEYKRWFEEEFTGSSNLYYNPDTPQVFEVTTNLYGGPRVYTDLAGWQAETNSDANAVWSPAP